MVIFFMCFFVVVVVAIYDLVPDVVTLDCLC